MIPMSHRGSNQSLRLTEVLHRRSLVGRLKKLWKSGADLARWLTDEQEELSRHQKQTLMNVLNDSCTTLMHHDQTPKSVSVRIDTLTMLSETAGPWTPKERAVLSQACDELLVRLDTMVGTGMRAKHVGLLPDMVQLVGQLNLFEDNRNKPPPLLHLLSKALPQRCQYRNFREIARGYCATSSIVNDVVRCIVFLSLGGYYPHVSDTLVPSTRLELYQYWYGLDNSQITNWVSKNSLLLFYVIKELLVYLCEFDSALMVVVGSRYNWGHYVSTTIDTMTVVRNLWGTPQRNHRANIKQELQRTHTRNCKHLHTLPGPTTMSKITNAIVMRFYEKKRTTPQPEVAVQCLFNIAQTINNGCDELTPWCGFKPQIVRQMVANPRYNPNAAQLGRRWDEMVEAVDDEKNFARFEDWDESQYSRVEMTVLQLRLIQQVRIVRLPYHFLHSQYHAVCRRFDIHPQATLDIERASTFYICLACQAFKGFAVDSMNEKTKINVTASGHDKVAYDDETGLIYCSKHKNERQTGPNTKYKQRVALLHHIGCAHQKGCEQTRCLPVNLLGNLILCYGQAYTLCFACGAPCVFRQGTAPRFTCGCCEEQEPKEEHCLFCRTKRGAKSRVWSRVWCLDDVESDPTARVLSQCSLCPVHSFRGIDRRRIWLRSTLLQRIASASAVVYGVN